jgi:hypothetical protein
LIKNDHKLLAGVKEEIGIQTFEINNGLKITDLSGSVFSIFDENRKKKCDAFCKVLKEISQYSKDVKKHRDPVISVIILVPEGIIN